MSSAATLPSSMFMSIVEFLSDAILVIDAEESILYCNGAAQNMFGYAREELLGNQLSIVIRSAAGCLWNHSGAVGGSVELHALRQDGWKTPVQVIPIALPDEHEYTAVVIRDIQDRKRAERRLIRSQQLGHVGSWERDIKNGVLYWSDEMFQICGIEPRKHFTVSEFLANHVHPDDVERVRDAMNMADTGYFYDMQYRVVRPDGDVRWLHAQGELEFTGDVTTSVMGCVKDITVYKKSVEELRRSKDNLKLSQKLAKLGHWDWDVVQDQIFWSDETYAIAGRTRNEFDNTYDAFLALVHPEDREVVHESLCRALQGDELDVEYRFLHSNGDICVLHVVGKVYFDASGTPIRMFGTCQDVTDKRRTEDMLVRSEKLAIAGQLAAGFAHEIRNPLTALRGFTQLLHAQSGGKDHQYYSIMMSELERITTIVDQLLVLAKPHLYATKPIEIRSLIEDVVALLRPQATMHDVEIMTDFSGDSRVDCEPNHMKQVFVNVVKNAIEAMLTGGALTIGLCEKEDTIEIQCSDQGTGIPKDIITKLGEPFYTTKPGGTGLGLMVSQKIVVAHNGKMAISSELGKGTKVTIELPRYGIGPS